jgi:hypothetical protein
MVRIPLIVVVRDPIKKNEVKITLTSCRWRFKQQVKGYQTSLLITESPTITGSWDPNILVYSISNGNRLMGS